MTIPDKYFANQSAHEAIKEAKTNSLQKENERLIMALKNISSLAICEVEDAFEMRDIAVEALKNTNKNE